MKFENKNVPNGAVSVNGTEVRMDDVNGFALPPVAAEGVSSHWWQSDYTDTSQ